MACGFRALSGRFCDGKIKALLSLGAFCLSGQWGYCGSRRKGLLALFGNSAMISMLFAPSSVAFG